MTIAPPRRINVVETDGSIDDRMSRFRDVVAGTARTDLAAVGSGTGSAIVFVFADAAGNLPPPDIVARNDNARVVLLGTAWWRSTQMPIDRWRAWNPWLIVGDMLPDEWPASWPNGDRTWLCRRFQWMPPLTKGVSVSEPGRREADEFVILSDSRFPAKLDVTPERVQECGAQGSLSWLLETYLSAHGSVRMVDVAQADEEFRSGEFVYSCLLDPADAHRSGCVAARAGVGFVNLTARTAPQRGIAMRHLMAEGGPDGVFRAPSIRSLLSPLVAKTVRGIEAVSGGEDAKGWLDALCRQDECSPAIAFSAALRRAKDAVGSATVTLRSLLVNDQIDDALRGPCGSMLRGELAAAATLSAESERSRLFWTFHRTCKRWAALAENTARDLAGRGVIDVDPLARVAWGIADGICQGFAEGWREELFSRANLLFQEDEQAGRLSSDGRTRWACVAGALGWYAVPDRFLGQTAAPPPDAAARVAWWRLRALGPSLEGARACLSNADDEKIREWLARNRIRGVQSRGAIVLEAIADVYAGRTDAALTAVARVPEENRGSIRALVAIFLWLCGRDTDARIGGFSAKDGGKTPVDVLYAATASALGGDFDLAGGLFGRLAKEWPGFFEDGFAGDTRWLFLGLGARALGWTQIEARARELSRCLHPPGSVRDHHFDRISPGTATCMPPDFRLAEE